MRNLFCMQKLAESSKRVQDWKGPLVVADWRSIFNVGIDILMAYAVVVRNGVWVRTLADRVLATDTLARGIAYQGPLRRSVLKGQGCFAENGKCVGFHQHHCSYSRSCEASVWPHLDHKADEKQQIELSFGILPGEECK